LGPRNGKITVLFSCAPNKDYGDSALISYGRRIWFI
jgi:hypothetical protein